VVSAVFAVTSNWHYAGVRYFPRLATCGFFLTVGLSAQTALIRHAPTLNGRVEGSIQQMTAESTTLNGGAEITGDLFVPGSPTVRLNGNPAYAGTLEGSGAATPATHTITLNGNAKLGHVVRRTDAVALPAVAAPPAPTGTRNVSLNNANQSPGDFATLRNLTLNGGVGAVTVPPGTYGKFTANGNSSFVLGIAGATTPSVYHFQGLTLNGNSTFTVVSPVKLTVNGTLSANSDLGSATHPEWIDLNIAGGGLTLNGNVSVYARLTAPDGTLTINGNSEFVGSVVANRLTLNGRGVLRVRSNVDRGVPFLADFEVSEGYQPGPLHGQNGWVVQGVANIVSSPVASGQQAVLIAPSTAVSLVGRLFTNSDPRITFVDLFAQPAAAATAATGVFLDTDAVRIALTRVVGPQAILHAFTGDGAGGGTWQPISKSVPLEISDRTSNWLRLTVRADYSAKRWDLYLDGRMIAADLGFFSNAPAAFTILGLSGHATLPTSIDDVLVAFDHPLFIDADSDGMEDAWESAYGLNPMLNDRNGDPDDDGLTNIREYILGTNPNSADTDGDGIADRQEINLGANPNNPDSDGDGMTDGVERLLGRNPLKGTLPDNAGVVNLRVYSPGN
jgi:hypothetical protein